MKKKLLISIMALCIGALYPLPVHAASSHAEAIREFQNSVEAYMTGSDGERIDLEITDVEVKQIPVPAEYRTQVNSSDLVAYAATAKTKTGTSSYEKNGIVAASSLTMTWVDGFGTNNKITNLTGYFTVARGTFQYGKIYWGGKYTGPTFAPYSASVGLSFNKNINYTSDDKVAGKVMADSIGYIKSPTDGRTYQLTLKVSPSIFD